MPAGVTLDISLDPASMKRLESLLLPDRDAYNRILKNALNAGERAAITAMGRAAKGAMGLTASMLRGRLYGGGSKTEPRQLARLWGKTAKMSNMWAGAEAGGGQGITAEPARFGILLGRIRPGIEITSSKGSPLRVSIGGTEDTDLPEGAFEGQGGKLPAGHVFSRKPGSRKLYEVRSPSVAKETAPASPAIIAAAEAAANARLALDIEKLLTGAA